MNIKDLLLEGFVLKERIGYSNIFTEPVGLDDLEGLDFFLENYEAGTFDFDLYVKGHGDCGIIRFSDFRDILKDSNNVSEFIKNFKEKRL